MKKEVTKMLPVDLWKRKKWVRNVIFQMCIPADCPHFDLARWSHGDHDEIFRRGLHMVELSCPTDQARCPTCLPSLSVVTYRLFNFPFLFHWIWKRATQKRHLSEYGGVSWMEVTRLDRQMTLFLYVDLIRRFWALNFNPNKYNRYHVDMK